jgi:hypothetical protein
MTNKRKSSLTLLLPAVGIGTIYAWIIFVWGVPGGAEVERLQKDHQTAQQSSVSPALVFAERTKLKNLQAEIASLTKQHAELCREGDLLCGEGVAPDRQIALGDDVVAVCEHCGMAVAEDHELEPRGQSGLATVLDRSLDDLAAEVAKPVETKGKRVAFRPEVIPEGAPPGLFPELAGTTSNSSRGKRTPPTSRELVVYGRYQQMATSLQMLASQSSEVAILSVAMEQPEVSVRPSDVKRWTIVFRLLPLQETPRTAPMSEDVQLADTLPTRDVREN